MGIKSSLVIPAVVAVGESGSSSDTTTFITNKIGTTVDITGLGTIKSVYKNGVLLQPFTYLTKHYFSTDSAHKFIQIDDTFDFNTANSWAIKFSARNNSGSWSMDSRFISNALVDYSTPVVGTDGSGHLKFWLSSIGNSWDIQSGGPGTFTLSSSVKKYYFVLYFTGTAYIITVSTDNLKYETAYSLDTSSKLYYSSTNSKIALLETGWEDTYSFYNPATEMPIEDFKVILDNVLVFDGANINANWTNVGNCTETTEQNAPSDNGAYNISGNSLSLSEALSPSDTLAIVH